MVALVGHALVWQALIGQALIGQALIGHAWVKLLELEMKRAQRRAEPRIPLRYPRARHEDLPANASAILPTERGFPWRRPRRYRRDYCEPIRRFSGYGPRARQTNGSRRPGRGRG